MVWRWERNATGRLAVAASPLLKGDQERQRGLGIVGEIDQMQISPVHSAVVPITAQ